MFPDDPNAAGMTLENNILGQEKPPGLFILAGPNKVAQSHPREQLPTVPSLGRCTGSASCCLRNKSQSLLVATGKLSHDLWLVASQGFQSVLTDLGCGL